MFSNMYAAYHALSDAMKQFLIGLNATLASKHIYRRRYTDRAQKANNIAFPSNSHPVVRTHTLTGRKALFYRIFTTRINELSVDENAAVLNMLFEHVESIQFQICFRWLKNDMAFLDNRCCMQRAIWDCWPEEHKGRRVTIKGERPVKIIAVPAGD